MKTNIDIESIKKMILFDDKKKGIVRTQKSMDNAIEARIRQINESRALIYGEFDYDDSRTEY